MIKFKSLSSPTINHDEFNIITEFILFNKYGLLPEFCWRKGQPLHEEWSRLVVVVKSVVTKLKITAGQLAWFVYKSKITEIDYAEFGLVKYRASKMFAKSSVADIWDFYHKQYEARVLFEKNQAQDSTYIVSGEYKTKEQSTSTKSLTSLLEALEKGMSI